MDLAKKVNKALDKVKAVPGVAYKRTVTISGYDPAFGVGTGSPTITDIKLNPQPAISTLSRESPLVLNGSGKFLATDYFALVSIDSFTLNELKTSKVSVVIKDEGFETDCAIVYFNAQGFNNKKVFWNMVLRAKSQV
jgi:hypothetical protein